MTAAGVITAVAVPVCSVQIGSSGQVMPGVPLARHLHAAGAVSVGDACVVETTREGQAWVTGVLGTAPAPPPPPDEEDAPTTPPKIVTGEQQFPPRSTGTWRAGWRTDTTDVIQGKPTSLPTNVGGAWYGAGIKSLPGDITAARVLLRRVAGGVFGAQQINMRLWAGTARPSGAPVLVASAVGPLLAVVGHGESEAWWPIPSSWWPHMVGGAFGIGCEGAPYVRLTAGGGGMTVVTEWRRAA